MKLLYFHATTKMYFSLLFIATKFCILQMILLTLLSVNILLVTSYTASLAVSELLKWNQSDLDRFLWIGTNGLISTFRELYLTEDLDPVYAKHFHGFKKFILVLPHLTEEKNMKNYSIKYVM